MQIKDLKGPPRLPLVGNSLQIKTTNMPFVLKRWADEYGDLYRASIGGREFVVVCDVDRITDVLRERPDTFRRITTLENTFTELGLSGVFSAEGATWRRHRALTNPAFNSAHLQNFAGPLRDITERLRKRWVRTAGEDIEVQKDLMRFTVDITTQLAFGYDLNTLESDGGVIQEHLEAIFPVLIRRAVALFPYWHYVKFERDRKIERALVAIRGEINAITTATRKRLAENPALKQKPSNFLEGLLSVDDGLTDDEVFGNVLTILVAGEDTTANSLAWMLHYLVEYPEIQEKIRNDPDGRYTDAVSNETLRLRSVAPLLLSDTIQDYDLQGLHLPAGTSVITLTCYPGFQDKYFSHPERFAPERWLGHPDYPNHVVKAFMPFGAGPRFCPGRNLAMLEMKTVAAMVTRNFKPVKALNGKVAREHFDFVAMPRDLWIRFEPQNVQPKEAPPQGTKPRDFSTSP